LQLPRTRWRAFAIAVLWSAWLVVHIALTQYFHATQVPLGADLFGYSWSEIVTTARGGMRMDGTVLAGWLLPVALMLALLAYFARGKPMLRAKAAAAVLIASAGLWLVPSSLFATKDEDEFLQSVTRNKLAYFASDSLRYWSGGEASMPVVAESATAAARSEQQPDPDYPFLHREQAPDVLGPHLNKVSSQPPHLVFIIVEGLGRSFSGSDAALGSFTPFLDELAGRSLYWSNFLAPQGRTFAVLPSIFGSLPFGEKGFAALGDRMPRHAGLLSVLKQQGYATRFYAGFDSDFDNERAYLELQGVDRIVDVDGFGPGYARNPLSSWGYDDSALVSRVLADPAPATPSVTVIQTMSMHTSYRFEGQDAWRRRFEQRLDELRVAEADKARYRAHADVYSTILFSDDALRRYFEAMQRAPEYGNTIFIVTGDHRLPEIPMDTKVERYHVPLIVFSPLLKQSQRIRAVSSQLDITPSLLAYLANNYGLRRPAQVAWTGSGLDTGSEFRNDRDIPLKHAKTILADFVSGPWFISHDQLYALEDGMRIAPVEDAAAKPQVLDRFARYLQANDHFARTLKLSPEADVPKLVAYAPPPAPPRVAIAPPPPRELYVHDIIAPEGSDAATVEVSARFTNGTGKNDVEFVPLLVLSGRNGSQLRESYAARLRLGAGGSGNAKFEMKLEGLPSGQYFIAVLPSHPETGKRVGEGIYRIPLKIRCCAPGGGALARP
jgi:phosphoglycerol transferase MdoB-like AlkP superfamily enzyme